MVAGGMVFTGAAVTAGAAVGISMLVSAFGNRVVPLEIGLDDLPEAFDGYRILLVTDIHRRILPPWLLKGLKGKVDLVLLGGDMTERGAPLSRLDANMKLIADTGPVYAVHGNHDYKADIKAVDRVLVKHGVRLLVDENVTLTRNGHSIWLTGVDYPKSGGKIDYAPLPGLLPGSEKAFRIILVHDPMWLVQRNDVPADLILSGHTHGGQVVLPVVGRRHVETFYHTYSAGMYQWPRRDGTKRSAKLFISRGFGTAHLPLRWRSPAEINLLTLRRMRK